MSRQITRDDCVTAAVGTVERAKEALLVLVLDLVPLQHAVPASQDAHEVPVRTLLFGVKINVFPTNLRTATLWASHHPRATVVDDVILSLPQYHLLSTSLWTSDGSQLALFRLVLLAIAKAHLNVALETAREETMRAVVPLVISLLFQPKGFNSTSKRTLHDSQSALTHQVIANGVSRELHAAATAAEQQLGAAIILDMLLQLAEHDVLLAVTDDLSLRAVVQLVML
jgi:hypothetical protein